MRRLREDRTWRLGFIPLLCVVLFPMAWAIGYSWLYSLGAIGRLRTGLTLQHWRLAVELGGLPASISYSLGVAAFSTSLCEFAALAATLTFPAWRTDRLILSCLTIPFATPVAIHAFLTYQMLTPGGILGRACHLLGWINSPAEFPVLVQDDWSVGIVVAQCAATLPLLWLFFLRTWSLARIDNYCRVAESLGASRWQARVRVALPMLASRGRPLLILTFLFHFGAYEIPLVLGRQYPQMFSVLTQRRFGQFDLLQRPQAFALALTYLTIASVGAWGLLAVRRTRV